MGKGIICALCGRSRSGKDTFANMLAEELYNILKSKFVLIAYAKDLKDRVQKDFDLHYDQLWGDDKETEDKRYIKSVVDGVKQYWTGREILQAYGQFFRTIDYGYWVKSLFQTIDYKEYKNIIITDVRHPNEAKAVSDRNGFLISITRDVENNIHGKDHISETALDGYDKIDFNIKNDGTLDDLRVVAKDTAKLLVAAQKIKKATANINL